MWCVLPLKPTAFAKHRLSQLLSPIERAGLMAAMAEDIILTLLRCNRINNILITSTEVYAARLAKKYRLHLLACPSDSNLNSAVSNAAEYLQRCHVETMLVLHGDLPQVLASDIDYIIDTHLKLVQLQSKAITIAPDNTGKGSNVLCCTPTNVIPFLYGPNSLRQHENVAHYYGVPFQLCFTESTAHDIDHPEDLAKFAATLCRDINTKTNTLDYLNQTGIIKKLQPLIKAPTQQSQPNLAEFKSARIQAMV